MPAPEPVVNVEQVMREIRERVYRNRPATLPGTGSGASLQEILAALDFSVLRQAADHAARCASKVGQLPPAPPTSRARLGAIFVRLVARMLFWYTPQIAEYQQASARALRDQAAAMERLAEAIRAAASSIHERLDRLEEQLRRERG